MNLKVRFKNPVFWVQLLLSLGLPVLTYYGLTAKDFTTWGMVFRTLGDAVSNPYVVGSIVVSIWNALNDPTTKGLSDSNAAMTYNKPK